ncbi:hypothetical protein SAY87_023974 [Trapa incisa]|uniref:RING-type E3 ubiquitin transferase n=1 Tax=Trapa incisa TaxID=236973 RepID=A0AAN7QUS2_9MYRT|nr:hypothetical protein SAY87_023974 [Trapa incisa]
MHERLIMIKQSQSQIPVPIPAHFCCPLSLELMTDPVIVATGQTYERAFIERWLDLGLTACPRTRQALENTNLIPNYTVKQLITSWCELNNVKLLDPLKSVSSHQSSLFLVQADSGTFPGNHIMSSKSHQALGSGVKNATGFIGINSREEGSLSNPQFSYDTSVPRVTGNQQRLDKGRQHLAASEGSSTILEDTTNLDGHPLISPSIIELFNAEHLTLRRNKKTVSALSTPTDMSLSQEAGRDANGSDNPALDQLMDYNSGASRKMKSETAYNLGTNRESEFPPQMTVSRSQNHIISRLPSEGSSPGIFPVSAAEAKPDISGIEIKVKMLVEDLQNGSLESQRQSTAELRLLAKDVDNRIVIANCGAVNVLIGMLNSHDASVQENAVTAILNLSINEKNKAAIASAHAIEPLIHVLKTGSPEARENSAAALYSISVTEDSKVRIGRSGAIAPLVDLLGNGTPRGKKDAVRALLNLSFVHENKVRIVKEGAVKYLVGLMVPDAGIVDKAVAVLANLAKILEGRIEICREGGIPLLVDVVELGSARGKENATSALLHLCTNNSKYCSVVLQEGALPPLVALSQFGTPRAKEKAHALIKHLRDQRRGNAGRSC